MSYCADCKRSLETCECCEHSPRNYRDALVDCLMFLSVSQCNCERDIVDDSLEFQCVRCRVLEKVQKVLK